VSDTGIPPTEPTADAPAPVAGKIHLPVGTALGPEATYALTRATLVRIVICAGEPESGKTTLLASIYDAFQDGPVGELNFAGSTTLHGFEQRCHTARAESGLNKPKTERTKKGEGFRFLHLRLWDAATAVATDLLLGDMSGELYRDLRDSSDECKKYEFMRLADHFVALLDGDKVATGFHAEAFGTLQALVRALLDADVLGMHSRLALLTTKWDVVERSGDGQNIVAALEERFRKEFEPRVSEVICLRVAARPEEGDEPVGLDHLLARWITVQKRVAIREWRDSPATRAFDRFVDVRRLTSPWSGTW